MTTKSLESDEIIRNQSIERRQAAIREEMAKQDIDALIAYGSGAHSFTGMNPAWYLSAFKQLGPHSAVVLPMVGDPILVITPEWDRQRCVERAGMEVAAVAPDHFLETIGSELERRQLKSKKLAVSGGHQQPQAIADAWSGVLGQDPVWFDKQISDLAKIRDEWSLTCARRAAAIAKKGYQRVLEFARPGMPEYIVAADLEMYMRRLGAEDNFQLLSASQHNAAGHFPTSRLLAQGDVLLGEITPAVEGEFLQICRSTVIGPPSDLQKEKFALLQTALRAGMKAAMPGVPVIDVVEAINKPIADAGYERYTKPPYMRTRGHSMALGSMEPELMPGHDHVFQKNMVFVMHPNQYIPETGYLMCGEPVIITNSGAEPLTGEVAGLGSIQ